jgi:hypothetical protein
VTSGDYFSKAGGSGSRVISTNDQPTKETVMGGNRNPEQDPDVVVNQTVTQPDPDQADVDRDPVTGEPLENPDDEPEQE